MSKKIHVYIGGGAAGFFAAIQGAENKKDVHHIILEATHRVMTKIKISGGGRCNVTHNCLDPRLLVRHYPRGEKELLGPFTRFQPKDTIDWFAQRGVQLKAEADGRMFPITDSSETIIQCLLAEADRLGVELKKGAKVKAISKKDSYFYIEFQDGSDLIADKVLLATGSTPLGYELAASLGHRIIDPVPSLFTFNIKHPLLENFMGTAFPKATLILEISKDGSKRQSWQQVGPLLITHWGLSGPAVLKLSAFAARELKDVEYQARLRVNWLGDVKTAELLDLFSSYKKDNPSGLLHHKAILGLSKRFYTHLLDFAFGEQKQNMTWSDLSKQYALHLAKVFTDCEMQITGKGVFKEEFVTCGGVDLKEVDFKTMQSKVCPGLYFAGEVLNIDGITGGFNFQNAWTGAWIAAQDM